MLSKFEALTRLADGMPSLPLGMAINVVNILFEDSPPNSADSPEVIAEWAKTQDDIMNLISIDKRIQAIKEIRTRIPGLNLLTAKLAVDRL